MDNLVSIIMPAYNSAGTIREAILSAMSQSHENIELIIVDDGSTDETSSICQRYAEGDKRIKLVSQGRRGVSTARNTGVKAAKGEFIAFFDSDDLWEREKIELQLDVARNHSDAVVLTELIRFSGDRDSRRFFGIASPPPYVSKDQYIRTVLNLNNRDMVSLTTALLRKSHLEAAGLYDEKLRTSEDWDLWIRLAFRCQFMNIDKPLYFYRKYQGSLTSLTKMTDTLQGQLYIIDKVGKVGSVPASDLRIAKMNKYLEFAQHSLYQNLLFSALLCISKAAFTCPSGCAELFLQKLANKAERLMRNRSTHMKGS